MRIFLISVLLYESSALLFASTALRVDLLAQSQQQCQSIQSKCAKFFCKPSEDNRTGLQIFLTAQESAIRGFQAELLTQVQWSREGRELSRQITALRDSVFADQVLLPREESAIFSRIDAMEQQISTLATKFDASDRPELEAMSNQLAYDFKLLRILSRPPTTPRGIVVSELKLHRNTVESIGLSADGNRAVSVDRDGRALVWDTRTGALITEFHGHGGSYIDGVIVSAAGSRAVSVGRHGKALVWDTRTGEQIREFRGHDRSAILSVSSSADGSRVVSVDREGRALLWETETGESITEFRRHGDSWINSVSLSADGRRAVSVDVHGQVLVWNAYTGELISRFLWNSESAIASVSFSANGNRAVSVDFNAKAFIWYVPNGQLIREFLGHGRSHINSVSLSADGSRAVSVGSGGKALLWDAHTGDLIKSYPEQNCDIRSVAWDELHGRFFFGLDDGRILVGE